MVIGIILMIILILLIIYISIKIGKTIIKTLITLVILTIVLLGLFGGLVYVDYKYYSNNMKEIALVYELNNSNIQLTFNKGVSTNLSNVYKVLTKNYNFKEESEKNNILYIVIPKSFLEEKLIPSKLTFKLPNKEKKNIEITLDKNEIIDILNDNYNKTYDKIIVGNYTNSSSMNNKLNFREITTLFLTQKILNNKDDLLLIIDAYKNDTVKVYPERESLKLIKKLIPTSTLESFIHN